MKIVMEGDPNLKRVARPWDFDRDGPVHLFAQSLVATAEAARGIGLAATQVGDVRRVFVIKLALGWLACVNPEIAWKSPVKVIEKQGCLSFPDLYIGVWRPEAILARWQDENGNWNEPDEGERGARLSGLPARQFMHELDHLNGLCMVDGRSVSVALARRKMGKHAR